jgi:ACS family tartrate transporter-like MFS transporter
VDDKQIFTKCAWRLIPFMVLLYVVNFVDRVNVGFAALTMNRDLGFSPAVYGFGAGILFFSYALFQVPANLMFTRLGARRWVFLMLATWGVISAANALVQGPLSFYALRFLLGAAEAGFFPGMIFYLTLWFPKAYRARFTASFMAAQQLSFIVGAPLSGLVLGLDGVGGLHGWQWLFLVEGLPACLLAIVVLRVLPDGPAEARWLTAEEKRHIAARLDHENAVAPRAFWPALRNPRVIALGLILLALNAGSYGVQLWLPQMVQAMGYSNSATGFIVTLPFIASVLVMILWGRSSDARAERVWHVAFPILIAASGFVVTSFAPSDTLVLVALAFTVIGIDAVNGPFWSLPSSFLSGAAAAGAIALIRTIGAMGGFVGPSIVGALRESTGSYTAGMATLAGTLILAALIALLLGRGIRMRKVQLFG